MRINPLISVASPLILLLFTACGSASNDEVSATQSAQQALGSERPAGAVFTMSNAATGNSIVAFTRANNGMLIEAGQTPTGGMGLGASLGSQGSLALDEPGRFLLAVNAGSNDVSSLAVSGTDLMLVSRVASGGTQPISVAVRDHIVYVLNAGQAGNISGFYLHEDGKLSPIAASTRPLSSAMSGPAQVGIAPFSLGVVVTEKNTSLIDTYTFMQSATLGAPMPQASSGMTPYGFAFAPDGTLIVSEATPGAVSSYALGNKGNLTTLSASVPDMQGAPCWVTVTEDGRFAYTANAHTSSISGYRVGRHGTLALLDPNGVTASTGSNSVPLDMAIDSQQHLYVVDSGNHAIEGFNIGANGTLTLIGSAMNLPALVEGIVAR